MEFGDTVLVWEDNPIYATPAVYVGYRDGVFHCVSNSEIDKFITNSTYSISYHNNVRAHEQDILGLLNTLPMDGTAEVVINNRIHNPVKMIHFDGTHIYYIENNESKKTSYYNVQFL